MQSKFYHFLLVFLCVTIIFVGDFGKRDYIMIRTNEKYSVQNKESLYYLPSLTGCGISDTLFVDIETTGFSSKTSDIYMIGTVAIKEGLIEIVQFFAESHDEEKDILKAFLEYAGNFSGIITFNGERFDIPFILDKCGKYGLGDDINRLKSLDIYKQIRGYKNQLGLPDCKQKTIELYLGINREDKYDGGKLINVYKNYVVSPDKEALNLLLLHNTDDLKGMLLLVPMLIYPMFFSLFANVPKESVRTDETIDDKAYDLLLPFKAVKVQADYYKDYDGKDKKEVSMKLALPYYLPTSLSGGADGFYFRAEGSEAILKVPLYEEELKYFYSNYKDYYYLPKEDMAIHKSLATFVDKDFREKAKPENCYTKKKGQYLKEWDLVFSPFFKHNYNDKSFFFDLNENMKQSRFAMSLYATHVIAHILDL